MKNVPKTVDKNNKSALFYFNHNDVSFHYMFSEINFFLNNVYRITDENSYKNYLKTNGFGNEFKPVEVYLHHNLIKTNSNQILIKNGEEEMNKDFPNTTWNSETSQSTLPDYFEGCTTKIYNVKDQNNFVVLSYNYTSKLIHRKIIVELENSEEIIYHKLEKSNSWSYHMFDRPIQKIKVYNSLNDELLYEMENKNIHSYIEFT